MAKAKQTYAKSLGELEQIMQDLESGKIGIDNLSQSLAKAKDLVSFCREKLRDVEAATKDLEV